MKDRLKELRKNHPSGKTQDMFADFLGIPKQNLSSYEVGRRNPSDAVIQLICEKCNVNEEWLRNGTGEIYNPIQDKLSFYLGQIQAGDDDFIRDIIEVYMELDQTSKDALKKLTDNMIEKRKNKGKS